MRKQCRNCIYGHIVEQYDIDRYENKYKGYLDKSFCSLHEDFHRPDREQRKCRDYENK